MKEFLVTIEADENDYDLISSHHEMDSQEIEWLKNIVKKLSPKGKHFRWATDECIDDNPEDDNYDPLEKYKDLLSQEDLQKFDDLLPNGEYGIHTVISITYVPLTAIGTIL